MAQKFINSNVSIKKNDSNKDKSAKPKAKPKQNVIIGNTIRKLQCTPVPKRTKTFESDMVLVKRGLLPKKFLKILKVKDAMYRGDAVTLKDALEEFDVTASTYQKYKNSILPFYEATNGKIFTLIFEIEHQDNALSDIISLISKHGGDILTIHQGFPCSGILSLNLTLDTTFLDINFNFLLDKLRNSSSVRYMEVIGRVNNTHLNRSK